MNKYFNVNRFRLLMVKELLLNRKNLLIMFISLVLFFLLLDFSPLSNLINDKSYIQHLVIYPLIMLMYCLILTSTSFSELNNTEQKIEFYMLPASITEKYAVKFIYTTLVFILISLASLTLAAIIAEFTRLLLRSNVLFKPIFHSYTFQMLFDFLFVYLGYHAIFFCGAVFFRKLESGKTLLVIITVIVTAGLYLFILNYMPFFKNTISREMIFQQFGKVEMQYSVQSVKNIHEYFDNLRTQVMFIFRYILPLILWTAAYFRLKEDEVKNGI